MKKLLLTVGCLVAGVTMARTIRPAQLAHSPYADTEVSTNVPCAFDLQSLKWYQFVLELHATDSNNVVVTVGHDGNRDGALSLGESALEFGWDSGAAFVRGLGGEATPEVEGPDSNGVSRISLFVPIRAHKANPAWLYDRNWDLVRVTRRGVDDPQERVSIRTRQSGLSVIIK